MCQRSVGLGVEINLEPVVEEVKIDTRCTCLFMPDISITNIFVSWL
jgi:hypothetical protein